MPIYGEAKTRNMIRSILPSTRRKTARQDRKLIHRAERARMRQALVDPDNERYDHNYYPNALIHDVKWMRRAHDKVAPIMRWGEHSTAHIEDPVERYMHLKKLLPDNTIGRHALGHLAFVKGIEKPGENPFEYGLWVHPTSTPPVDYKPLLRKVIETGNLAAFNRAIKRAHLRSTYPRTRKTYDYGHRIFNKDTREYELFPCDCVPRTLKGLHDVDSFLADLSGKLAHPEWKKAMTEFLGE